MGVSRETWAGLFGTTVLAGTGVIVAVVTGGIGIAIGMMMIGVGVLGFGWLGVTEVRHRKPNLEALAALMAEGRVIRDSMAPGKSNNPNNSRINQPRCKVWEQRTHEAIQPHDPALAESFLLGRPEVDPVIPRHPYDGINWLLFMEGRLKQLDEIIDKLRRRS